MGFGTSKQPLLGCTGTSVHLEEILTTSPYLENPQVQLASASRCCARFLFLILVGLHEPDSSCLFAQRRSLPTTKGWSGGPSPRAAWHFAHGLSTGTPAGLLRRYAALLTLFNTSFFFFFFQTTSQLLDVIRNNHLNHVYRLLWRSTAPLMTKWSPVWRWLTLSCSPWPVLSTSTAHLIVWTQHILRILIFIFH